jgi:formiminoglutamase
VARLAVLGAPLNKSITPGRCDLAPAAVRQALARFSPFDLEAMYGAGLEHSAATGDLRRLHVRDRGDLQLADQSPEDALAPLSEAVREGLAEANAVVILGGDNGVTRPACHGLGVPLERLGVITLDAHFDLRDLDGGLMNGNPIRALLADGLPGRNIVQIGLQSFANSAAYAEVAREAGIGVITADQARSMGPAEAFTQAVDGLQERVDAIYFDLDLDVMDRAIAPGCPGARPGGLQPWEVRQYAALAGSHPKVRAIDLVELDPEKDINHCTTLTAAACLLAFASGLLQRSQLS